MKAVITFKEYSNPSIVEEAGGVVDNVLQFIPRLLNADITQTMHDELIFHPEIQSITWMKDQVEERISGNYKTETATYGYHLNALRAMDYWDRGLTGKGVKVAVIDYAVGHNHAMDIAGGVSLVSPVNYTQPPSDITSYLDQRHGTQCASLICGKPIYDATNGIIGGTAPDVELYGVKYSGDNDISDRAGAINWCIANDIDIISISMTWYGDPDPDGIIWQAALDAGIIVVAAAGNTDAAIVAGDYPACLEGITVVSGLNKSLQRHTFNYGSQVQFSAPCLSVPTLDYTLGLGNISSGTLGGSNGTSFATPAVAGIIALYKQAFPTKTNDELLKMIADNARKINGNYWDQFVGWGLPQPSEEIMALPKRIEGNGQVMGGNGDYIDCGNSASLNVKDKLTLIAKVRQNFRNTGHVFAKANTGGSQIFYGMLLGHDGIYSEWRRSGVQEKPKYPRSVADNQVHTIAFVYDYPTVRMYIDGKLMRMTFNMIAAMDLSAAADKLLIGSNKGTSTGSFSGTIYSAKVYNRAFTDSEVLNDYGGELVSGGLQLYYEFTGAESNVVTDLSGNGNHGTIFGARAYKPVQLSNGSTSDQNAIIAPIEVTGLTATPADHSITLSWTTSASPGAVRYDVYQLGVGKKKPLITTAGTSYTINLLESNTTYSFKVITVDSLGNASLGVILNPKTLIDTAPPNPASSLNGTAGKTGVLLGWTASTSTDVFEYEVWQGASGSVIANATLVAGNIKTTYYAVEHLSPSTTYNFWVIAKDKAGNKSTTILKTVTTVATDTVLYQDTFTRADATTLGSTEAPNPTAWTYISTTRYGIIGNQVYPTTNPSWIQPALLPVSYPNYAVEMVFNNRGTYAPILWFRFGSDYSNSMGICPDVATGQWGIRKIKNGANTKFDDGMSDSVTGIRLLGVFYTSGDKVRAECYSDGTIKVFINDILRATTIDKNAMMYNQRVGFGASDASVRLDNFKVEVLSMP